MTCRACACAGQLRRRVDQLRPRTIAGPLADGRVVGWGGDGSGNPPPEEPNYCSSERAATRAVFVPTPEAIAIAAGHGVSLAIDARRRLLLWGADRAGVAGKLASVALFTPQAVAGLGPVKSVAAREFLFGAINRRNHQDAATLETWTRLFDECGFRVRTLVFDQWLFQKWRNRIAPPRVGTSEPVVSGLLPLAFAYEFIFILEHGAGTTASL